LVGFTLTGKAISDKRVSMYSCRETRSGKERLTISSGIVAEAGAGIVYCSILAM
jgi:hypothetical protein